MTFNLKWTPEEDARLFEYAAMGLSAADAAKLFGKRRNQIMGRAFRIGARFGSPKGRKALEGRERKSVAKSAESASRIATAPKAPTLIFEKPEIVTVPKVGTFIDGGVAIWDLETHHCRWGDGDPRDAETFRYCGATTEVGNSWCATHRKILTIPGSAQNAKRPAVSPRRVVAVP